MMDRVRLIFEKQWLHASLLSALVIGLVLLSRIDSLRTGQRWGVSTPAWLWLAVVVAVAHQVFVWFCWRTQLHASLLTRALGDWGFVVYAALFAVLGLARVVVMFILAISNRDTLPMNLVGLRVFAVIALLPAIYLFYSVARYFGFTRAFGVDHFDARYRSLPFVRRGTCSGS